MATNGTGILDDSHELLLVERLAERGRFERRLMGDNSHRTDSFEEPIPRFSRNQNEKEPTDNGEDDGIYLTDQDLSAYLSKEQLEGHVGYEFFRGMGFTSEQTVELLVSGKSHYDPLDMDVMIRESGPNREIYFIDPSLGEKLNSQTADDIRELIDDGKLGGAYFLIKGTGVTRVFEYKEPVTVIDVMQLEIDRVGGESSNGGLHIPFIAENVFGSLSAYPNQAFRGAEIVGRPSRTEVRVHDYRPDHPVTFQSRN